MARISPVAVFVCAAIPVAGTAQAQDRQPELRLLRQPLAQWTPEAIDAQVRRIAEERPPQAEAAARAFLLRIAPTRFSPAVIGNGMLDSLRRANFEQYWLEVARLTVQFDIFQNVHQLDSGRASVLAAVFAAEFEARDIQRQWRSANEGDRRAMRARLEQVMGRHFDSQQRLQAMEFEDMYRRLDQARIQSEQRAARRSDHVRFAVEGIIRDAERPE